MFPLVLAAAVALPIAAGSVAGLARTPPMGWNSWTSFGTHVNETLLLDVADAFVSSGLRDAGYATLTCDDYWSTKTRGADGKLAADAAKFPSGIPSLVAAMHAKGLKFGMYSSASSVMCSGNAGSLYHEAADAETFAVEWGVDYLKYDNCGEYALGLPRFTAMADALNATGKAVVLSTEPFSLVPNPLHSEFCHLYRTGNDIDAQYATITDRADLNERWHRFTGPERGWADPDMLQCGHPSLSDAECRSHFALWAVSKAPLIIGADVRKLTPSVLAVLSNAAVIAVNQDAAGVQGWKLSAGGKRTAQQVGLAPCAASTGNAAADATLGYNGVAPAEQVWSAAPLQNRSDGAVQLVHAASGRCLGVRPSYPQRTGPIPALFPCNETDDTQAWTLPRGGSAVGTAVTGLLNAGLAAALTVGDGTLYGAVHGKDAAPLLDASYGLVNLTFTPYAPQPPCSNRSCDDYIPQQSWQLSARTGRLSLSAMAANGYRCFEGSCYVLTGHYPAADNYCLTRVAAISNDGTDNDVGGVHVWGGPLAGGAFVFVLENRGAAAVTDAGVEWEWLEAPYTSSLNATTPACVTELFSGKTLGVFTGGVSGVALPSHDAVMLRVVPNAAAC